MKRLSIGVIAGLSIALLVSFKSLHEQKKSIAEVETIDGLLIFTDAKPVNAYEVIGNLRTAGISYSDDSYIQGRNHLIEKCKKTYPTAEALIFTCSETKNKYVADVINFKK